VFPGKRIAVNLAHADIRKESPAYDLPIAVGVLIALAQAIDIRRLGSKGGEEWELDSEIWTTFGFVRLPGSKGGEK
jgi:predicted ATPase with chaperone activity